MADFIQTVENDAEAVWIGFRAVLEAAWGDFDQIVAADMSKVLTTTQAVLTALAPTIMSQLMTIIQKAILDVVDGDFGNLETDVLNGAMAAGLADVATLKAGVLPSIISLVKTTL